MRVVADLRFKMIAIEFDAGSHWIFNAEEVTDLRLHKTNPKIIETDSVHPTQVILLIGESFSKNHSSLYGYDKPTNPYLTKLLSDSSLIVFNNVTSPSTFTIDAFKYILNDYQKKDNARGNKWYDSTSIIEAMNKVGYYTMWISNQRAGGMYDNTAFGYSRLCDKSYFNTKTGDDKYDEYLLTIDTDTATEAHNKCLIIYHFMGQHGAFNQRFPEPFKHFSTNDYLNHPNNQRQILADYDNATLFNDYVVGEIINSYKNREAIIIYFPDHALDVFDTDDKFGHARNEKNSIEHCRQIPFMVYVSPSLDNKAPDIKKKILIEKDKKLCTDNLFDFVLHTAGYAKE
ncbi:MAG: phosphoethanolamine transferase [Muribaculaceae bacterium]